MTYTKVEGQTLKNHPFQKPRLPPNAVSFKLGRNRDPRGLPPLTDEVTGATAAAAARERREGVAQAASAASDGDGGSRGEDEGVEDYKDLFLGGSGSAGMIMIP